MNRSRVDPAPSYAEVVARGARRSGRERRQHLRLDFFPQSGLNSNRKHRRQCPANVQAGFPACGAVLAGDETSCRPRFSYFL